MAQRGIVLANPFSVYDGRADLNGEQDGRQYEIRYFFVVLFLSY
jgi:hypothetical protein